MSELLGKRCRHGHKIQVLRSPAGYYIGTNNEMGMSNCRLSGYAKTQEQANNLMCNRIADEIIFCNQRCGCMNNPVVVWTHDDQLVCARNAGSGDWDIYTAEEWAYGEDLRSKEWEGCSSLEEALEWCQSWEPTEFNLDEDEDLMDGDLEDVFDRLMNEPELED